MSCHGTSAASTFQLLGTIHIHILILLASQCGTVRTVSKNEQKFLPLEHTVQRWAHVFLDQNVKRRVNVCQVPVA
jgi:hypothetical protein